jgi:beta-lactam-binding protein with PASTA domain/tRNA A-37 threonylcarbamoyl transferase component Bud32
MESIILGNRYELHEEIGSGGMAHVFKARDQLLDRNVAIKILKPEYTEDAQFIDRFRVEAQAAASLSNPSIVMIYDVGQDDGIYYIVMEYVDGVTLKDYIAGAGFIAWKEAASLAIQMTQAIDSAHQNHIIHRDIKPHNILITRDRKIKITDFGIARAASSSTMTMVGNAMGSVHYFSPEQAKGSFTDEKSDIYSLGITLYEMVTGEVPFEGDTPISVALKHIQELPVPPSERNPQIPEGMSGIILKAIAKDKFDRYQSMGQMLQDLRKVLKDPSGGSLSFAQDAAYMNGGASYASGGAYAYQAQGGAVFGQRGGLGADMPRAAGGGQGGFARQGGPAAGHGVAGHGVGYGNSAAAGYGDTGHGAAARAVGGNAAGYGAAAHSGGAAFSGGATFGGTGYNGGAPVGGTGQGGGYADPGDAYNGVDDGYVNAAARRAGAGGRRGSGGRGGAGGAGGRGGGSRSGSAGNNNPDGRNADGRNAVMIVLPLLAVAVAIAGVIWIMTSIFDIIQPGDRNDGAEFLVDSYSGQPYSEVRDKLSENGIRAVENRVSSDDMDRGLILWQSVGKGMKLRTDGSDEIRFDVGDGPERVEIPAYENTDSRAAETFLKSKGLNVQIIEEESRTVQRGYVIRTEPPAGNEVEAGGRIVIYRSLGSDVAQAEVPQLYGKTYADAVLLLNGSNLAVGQVSPAGAGPGAVVVNQSPAANSVVDEGVAVDLWLEEADPSAEASAALEQSAGASASEAISSYLSSSASASSMTPEMSGSVSASQSEAALSASHGLSASLSASAAGGSAPAPGASGGDSLSASASAGDASGLGSATQSEAEGQPTTPSAIEKRIKLHLPTDREFGDTIKLVVEVTRSDTGTMRRVVNKTVKKADFPYDVAFSIPANGESEIKVYYDSELMATQVYYANE